MPNTTPIPTLISVELQTRLERILGANGYSFDVEEVYRLSRHAGEYIMQHLSIRIDQTTCERNPELDYAGNPPAICWMQTYELKCFCRNSNKPQDETDAERDEPFKINVNEMAAAAIRAVTNPASSPSTWHTMGGNAFDTQFGPLEEFNSEDGEYNGITVPVVCYFRVSENNPFEIR